MSDSMIPAAATIPLKPLNGTAFSAIVILSAFDGQLCYGIWVISHSYGIGMESFAIPANGDTSVASIEGIKKLDSNGYFDPIKEHITTME